MADVWINLCEVSRPNPLVGIPWKLGGRSKAGMDCLGLVLAACRARGIAWEDPWSTVKKNVQRAWKDPDPHMPKTWARLDLGAEIREGDVLFTDDGFGTHVMFVHQPGWVLTTSRHMGSRLVRLRDIRRAVREIWRPERCS